MIECGFMEEKTMETYGIESLGIINPCAVYRNLS